MVDKSTNDDKNKYAEVRWEPLTKEEREEIDKYHSKSSKSSKSSLDKTS